MSSRRGLTIAETLVVAVIIGLMLFAIAGAVPPLLAAPARAQAKAESMSPASSGMYVFERDLRESDANAIFACNGAPVVCGSGSIATADSAVVMATAVGSDDLGASFETGGLLPVPSWQGFIIYWQRAPGGDVYRSFEPAPIAAQIGDPSPQERAALQRFAQDAIASAVSETQPMIVMRNIAEFSAAVNTTNDVTSIHVVASGQAGYEQNTSTFDDDVLAHN